VSGMIVETVEEAIAAVPRLLTMDRRAVRKQFELRFSSARMANDYVHPYRRMLRRIGTDKIETEITESPALKIVEIEAMNWCFYWRPGDRAALQIINFCNVSNIEQQRRFVWQMVVGLQPRAIEGWNGTVHRALARLEVASATLLFRYQRWS
jgi:hypothetical protein